MHVNTTPSQAINPSQKIVVKLKCKSIDSKKMIWWVKNRFTVVVILLLRIVLAPSIHGFNNVKDGAKQASPSFTANGGDSLL